MNTSRATSFATYQDLVGYIKCLLGGDSETHCYNYGDNGVGASGKTTAQIHTPMVALPAHSALGKHVSITLQAGFGHGEPFIAEVADIGPEGVIDLNPAALIAAGLPEDKELSCSASWEWV